MVCIGGSDEIVGGSFHTFDLVIEEILGT